MVYGMTITIYVVVSGSLMSTYDFDNGVRTGIVGLFRLVFRGTILALFPRKKVNFNLTFFIVFRNQNR